MRKTFKPLTLLLLIAIQCVTIWLAMENRENVVFVMTMSSIYMTWGWLVRSIF